MITALVAAAAVNSITAPYGLWARATWGATRPNVELQIENRSKVDASLIDIACDAFDARGKLVAQPAANLAGLAPGAAAHTWATADRGRDATRFACRITVDAWFKPREPGDSPPAKPKAAPAAAATSVPAAAAPKPAASAKPPPPKPAAPKAPPKPAQSATPGVVHP